MITSLFDNGQKQKSESASHEYEILVYWDEESNLYVGGAPELAGCMAHGKTPVEAVQNINEAIELWLETAREFGDHIPEPRRHQLAA